MYGRSDDNASFFLYKMLQKKQYTVNQSLFRSIFFLLSHFWIFRIDYQMNDYMLRTSDACTYFFYVIPNLMNATAVLRLEADPPLRNLRPSNTSYLKKSVFFVCLFLYLFKHMVRDDSGSLFGKRDDLSYYRGNPE